MDANFPYFPSHTSVNKHHEIQMQNDNENLLLSTEPKDLAKLFNHRSTAEQDICFPHSRSSEEQETKDKRISHKISSTTIKADDDINLDALTLFHNSPIPSHQYRRFQPDDDELKVEPVTDKLYSLYGDNKTSNDSPDAPSLKQDTYRFMYYHPDTGCIQGRTLIDMNLPPNTTLQSLLLKKKYWIDITSPTDEEMKAVSKVRNFYVFRDNKD